MVVTGRMMSWSSCKDLMGRCTMWGDLIEKSALSCVHALAGLLHKLSKERLVAPLLHACFFAVMCRCVHPTTRNLRALPTNTRMPRDANTKRSQRRQCLGGPSRQGRPHTCAGGLRTCLMSFSRVPVRCMDGAATTSRVGFGERADGKLGR